MENLTKALLIAAGMLIAIMILSLLVIAYNRISGFYEHQQEILSAEQLDKFNKQFQTYADRENIRGNELISLMNKIIDYNVSQSYQDGTNYEPIKVKITIGNQFVEAFKYETDEGTKLGVQNNYITPVIENTVDNVNNQSNDKKLIEITNTPNDAMQKAQSVGINNITDTQLQKLTMEISTILVDESRTDNSSNEYRRLRAIALRNILKLDIGTTPENDIYIDPTTYKTIRGGEKIEAIKEIVSQYYQYTQFKRACFKCPAEGVKYNPETGRVIQMNFEVQTEVQNGETVVKFN